MFRNLFNKKKLDLLKLDGCNRFCTNLRFTSYFLGETHHPYSIYTTELIRAMQQNLCLVFNDSCGAVDCINEAACETNIPTIVLSIQADNDSISVPSMKNAISSYLQHLPFQSFLAKFLHYTSSLFDSNHNFFHTYLNSMKEDDCIELFNSLLKQYPIQEIPIANTETTIKRSSVVIIRVDEIDTILQDYSTLQTIVENNPSSLFIISFEKPTVTPRYEEVYVLFNNHPHSVEFTCLMSISSFS